MPRCIGGGGEGRTDRDSGTAGNSKKVHEAVDGSAMLPADVLV